MAKHSENFAAAAWDKKGGSCSVTSDSIIAPDGNQAADVITAVTATPVIQQQIAGLRDGGTCTFYAWARVPSGTRKVWLAIVNDAYGAHLTGPKQVNLTASWWLFGITGTLASGQTGLWIVVRQFSGNGDDWTAGDIHLRGGAASSRGTISKPPTPEPGHRKASTLPPALPSAPPSSPRRTLAPRYSRSAAPDQTSPRAPSSKSQPTESSSSPAAPATATASRTLAPPITRPASPVC